MNEQTIALLNKLVAEYTAHLDEQAGNPHTPGAPLDDEGLMLLACALADASCRSAKAAGAELAAQWEDYLPPSSGDMPLSTELHAAFDLAAQAQ